MAWTVKNGDGEVVGYEPTEDAARGVKRYLDRTGSSGPYKIEEVGR